MSKELMVPFDEDGGLMDWVKDLDSWENKKPNYNFLATMRIVGMRRGRSAAKFVLTNTLSNGIEQSHTMFMSEALNMMKTGKIIDGVITGAWTFCKRGQNYSLKFLQDVSVETIEALHRGLEDAKAGRLVTSEEWLQELRDKANVSDS